MSADKLSFNQQRIELTIKNLVFQLGSAEDQAACFSLCLLPLLIGSNTVLEVLGFTDVENVVVAI
jgi:hypothetical protein